MVFIEKRKGLVLLNKLKSIFSKPEIKKEPSRVDVADAAIKETVLTMVRMDLDKTTTKYNLWMDLLSTRIKLRDYMKDAEHHKLRSAKRAELERRVTITRAGELALEVAIGLHLRGEQ